MIEWVVGDPFPSTSPLGLVLVTAPPINHDQYYGNYASRLLGISIYKYRLMCNLNQMPADVLFFTHRRSSCLHSSVTLSLMSFVVVRSSYSFLSYMLVEDAFLPLYLSLQSSSSMSLCYAKLWKFIGALSIFVNKFCLANAINSLNVTGMTPRTTSLFVYWQVSVRILLSGP